jgi:photosystem II stability/assembly factor-like uncharacterized protein
MKFIIRTLLIALLALGNASLLAQDSFWHRLEKPYGGGVFIFAFAPNGDIVVGSEFSGTFRSTDNGRTWNRFGTSNGGIYIFGVNAQGAIYGMSDDRGGAYRTTDNGATWEKRSAGIETRRLRYMALSPNGHLFAATDSGIYRSIDGAESWSLSGSKDMRVDAIFATPAGSILAITGGVLYHSDDGVAWNRAGEGLWDAAIAGLTFGEGNEVLLLAGNHLFRSTDGREFDTAATFPSGLRMAGLARGKQGDLFSVERTLGAIRISGDTITQLGLPIEGITGLAVASNGNILAGFERRGIYVSADNGDHWEHAGLPYSARIVALAEINGGIIAGESYGGISRSTDGGESWTDLKLPGERTKVITIDGTATGAILVGAGQGTIFRSTDNGASWTKPEVSFVTDVNDVLVTGNGTVLIASNNGVVRSVDNGDNWYTMIADENIYTLAQAPNGDIWGGGFKSVFRSDDAGLTWGKLTISDENIRVESLGILPDGSIIIGTGSKVLRSTDNGASWVDYEPGCPTGRFELITASDGATYMSNTCGIHRLAGGANWTKVADWPSPQATSALLVTSGGTLYAGGNGGLYRSQSPLGVGTRHTPAQGDLRLSVSPNPARESVAISFTLPKTGPVSLTMHSMCGETVATLVDESLAAGEHAVEWSADGMPSGVYLYQLRGGEAVGTGRIEIVR